VTHGVLLAAYVCDVTHGVLLAACVCDVTHGVLLAAYVYDVMSSSSSTNFMVTQVSNKTSGPEMWYCWQPVFVEELKTEKRRKRHDKNISYKLV